MPATDVRPSRWQAILLTALAMLTAYSYLRGQRNEPEWAGIAYYVIDYSDGLIRRGLIGQMFMLAYSRAQPDAVFAAAVLVHRFVCMLMMLGLLVWFWSVLPTCRRFSRKRLILVYLTYLAGQFLPTLAAINTYLDAYILLLIFVGFALAASGRPLLAGLMGFVTPFIHEMSVILWASLALMIFWRDGPHALRQPKIIAMVAAPALGQAVLMACEPKHAVALQLARAPISPQVRNVMANQQLGHRLLNEMAIQMHLIAAHPIRGSISVIGFATPAMIMFSLLVPALDRRARVLLALSGLVPLGILAIAYDLSRFVVLTQLMLMLSVLFMAATPAMREPADRGPARWVGWMMAPVLAFGFCMPLVYGYFDSTQIVTNEVLDNAPVLGPHLRALYAVLQR